MIYEEHLGAIKAAIAMSMISMRTFDEITDDFFELAAGIRSADLAKAAYPTGTLAKLTGIRDELRAWRRSQPAQSIVTSVFNKTDDTRMRRPPGVHPEAKYEYSATSEERAAVLT